MKNIEHTAVDILNAGLGLIKAGEETVSEAVATVQKSIDEAVANVEKTFEDLKYKGASDYSSPAVKARELVSGAAKTVSGSKG